MNAALSESLFLFLFAFPNFIFALTAHGFCKALVAHLLGDSTPKNYGFLTLNPLKQTHTLNIALFLVAITISQMIFKESSVVALIALGLQSLGLTLFKEVPMDSSNFKKPDTHAALSLFAGPLGVLLYACILFAGMRFLPFTVEGISQLGSLQNLAFTFFNEGSTIAIFLSIFTLIPLPPQTGGQIVLLLIPEEYEEIRDWYSQYGIMIFLGLLLIPGIRGNFLRFITIIAQGIKIMIHALFFKLF